MKGFKEYKKNCRRFVRLLKKDTSLGLSTIEKLNIIEKLGNLVKKIKPILVKYPFLDIANKLYCKSWLMPGHLDKIKDIDYIILGTPLEVVERCNRTETYTKFNRKVELFWFESEDVRTIEYKRPTDTNILEPAPHWTYFYMIEYVKNLSRKKHLEISSLKKPDYTKSMDNKQSCCYCTKYINNYCRYFKEVIDDRVPYPCSGYDKIGEHELQRREDEWNEQKKILIEVIDKISDKL